MITAKPDLPEAQEQKLLEAVIETQQFLVSAGSDEETWASQLLGKIGEALEADSALLFHLPGGALSSQGLVCRERWISDRFRPLFSDSKPSTALFDHLFPNFKEQLVSCQFLAVHQDLDTPEHRLLKGTSGMTSLLIIPIPAGQSCSGFLQLCMYEAKRQWESWEIKSLGNLARGIALREERIQREQSAKPSAEHDYSILEKCGDGILLVTEQGEVLYVSESVKKLFPSGLESFLKDTLPLIIRTGQGQEMWFSVQAEARQEEHPELQMDRILEGEYAVFAIRARAISWAESIVHLAIFDDVSGKNQQELENMRSKVRR